MDRRTGSEPETGAGRTMPESSIALLGLKHSGKSSVAVRLAERLDLPCVDTDRLLSIESGCAGARDAYKTLGREGFRKMEYRVCGRLARRAARELVVIATGGGIADNEKALDVLSPSVCFVYLRESESVLYERFMGGGRPAFLPEDNTREAWARIYMRRDKCYLRRAFAVIDCRGRSIRQITEEAIGLLVPDGRFGL